MPSISPDNQYYIDLADNSQFNNFVSIHPEGVEFDDRVKGVGNCSWQISFSAKDVDDAVIIRKPVAPSYIPDYGPYRTYYRLRYGNIVIQAGVLTDTETALGDDFVSMHGKTWEHYLERWQYPFDPRATPQDPISNVDLFKFPNSFIGNEASASGTPTPAGLVYQCYQRDVILIMKNIIQKTISVPYRQNIDFSSLNASTLSGIKTNFQFSLGDTTYMDSFINGLSETGEGFDWWITWYGAFLWASPYRFGDPGNPTIVYTIDDTTELDHQAISFHNAGPTATHVLGQGAGLSSQTKLARAYGYENGQLQWTRLDKSYDFGDVRNRAQLVNRTQKQLSADLQPQRSVPLTLVPDRFPNFYSTFRKGRAIWIVLDMYFVHVESLWQIMELSGKDNEDTGNFEVELTLEQRFDLSTNAGTAEG